MKFNMGCGYNKIPGHINVDASAVCSPDVVCDLETLPWPWETSVADVVVFNHSLEHMGQDPEIFLGIMKELYRICKHGAEILINVPHPRHDNFLGDPTHVRTITPITLSLFDKENNDQWKKMGAANTPFAHYLGVDFRTVAVQMTPDDQYCAMLLEKRISLDQLKNLASELNNVITEYHFKLQAVKQSTPEEIGHLVTLLSQCRYTETEALARKMTENSPGHGFGWKALGVVLKLQGLTEDALAPMQKASIMLPEDAEVHKNLGIILKDLGRLNEAEVSYRTALKIKPDYAEVHNNLGITLYGLGRLEEAESSYRRAVEIKSDYADAYYNLGIILTELVRLKEAEASYRKALDIKPDYAEAHNNLGTMLKELGRLKEAEACYRRALEIKPDFAEAHYNLGNIHMEQDRFIEAEASYRSALDIKPDFAEVHYNLGVILKDMGRWEEAECSYLRAHEIKPDAFQYAVNAHLILPIIHDISDSVAAWRQRYETGITALMDIMGSLDEPAINVNTSSFYLAYQNFSDRKVMEALRRLFRARVPDLTFTAPHVMTWQPPKTRGQRIRVGFLSHFLVEHTIGHLNQGFIRHLDRNQFEVVVIHSSTSRQDAFRKNLDALADKVLTLPAKLKDQQQAVAAEKLDLLFYPDIGMTQSTYFLAYARLAPVQAVTWGHPDTTGLDSIDYFVSVSSFEPEGAEVNYTETLIRMNRLNCYYQPPETFNQVPERIDLGLPEIGTLYGCPQSLFKFHPDFDAVLATIASGDPTGWIIMLEGKHSSWSGLLKARWKKSFPVLLDRVLFLPRMPRDRFTALQARIDVLLDPAHFGGGNTFYEAMIYGTPMVTFPGTFMRSRIAATGYWQMGVEDAPVASSLEEYALLALSLGRDPERRNTLRQASKEAAGRELFADMSAVREFEAFLTASVVAAGRGGKLPLTWRPEIR